MNATPHWQCPNCNIDVGSAYCPSCGEASLYDNALSLRGIINQIFTTISNIDRRVIESCRELLLRPGNLTLKYKRGERKRYLLPINLFLFANVVFFTAQSYAGAKIFSTPLDMHLHNQFWSGFAQYLLDLRLASLGMSLSEFASLFDEAVILHAKTLIVLMVPPFAALLPLIFYRSRQPMAVHISFALHYFAFLLFVICVTLALLTASVWMGSAGLESETIDHLVSILQLFICGLYLFMSSKKVYGGRDRVNAIKAGVLTAATMIIFLGYRFALFVITLYTV